MTNRRGTSIMLRGFSSDAWVERIWSAGRPKVVESTPESTECVAVEEASGGLRWAIAIRLVGLAAG